MYYNLSYILFDWKLGWWEIGAKIMVFQEIYETLLYLLAPFVIPISFAVRPLFSLYLYIAVIVMYIGNALIFNYVSRLPRHDSRLLIGSTSRFICDPATKPSPSKRSSTTFP